MSVKADFPDIERPVPRKTAEDFQALNFIGVPKKQKSALFQHFFVDGKQQPGYAEEVVKG